MTTTKRTSLVVASLLAAGAFAALAQKATIISEIIKMREDKIALALPEFRGAGGAAPLMAAFNQVLWDAVEDGGVFRMVPRTMYPLQAPQRPQDFKQPTGREKTSGGLWLSDWAGAPVSANYLAVGYTAEQDGRLVLFGYLYNTTQPDVATAQVFGKLYNAELNEAGARKVAREYAADILKQFGVESLSGTRIFFISDRTGSKEIWSMDYDGSNQKQMTNYRTITTTPAASRDGSRFAFASYLRGQPEIVVHSTETGRRLPFYNQAASLNATPDFSPDGKQLIFASTAGGGYAQIYMANVDGSNVRRLTNSRAVEVEPKINPVNPSEVVFTSGRSGPPQIYRMNVEGADVDRLTTGEGEAVNPSWHPNGKLIAFAWTRGYELGGFNIFVMDVASGRFAQLTSGTGRNENPSWAPDGAHIVFSSRRSGRTQLYSMLADGTQVRQLTTQGNNEKPVWTKGSTY